MGGGGSPKNPYAALIKALFRACLGSLPLPSPYPAPKTKQENGKLSLALMVAVIAKCQSKRGDSRSGIALAQATSEYHPISCAGKQAQKVSKTQVPVAQAFGHRSLQCFANFARAGSEGLPFLRLIFIQGPYSVQANLLDVQSHMSRETGVNSYQARSKLPRTPSRRPSSTIAATSIPSQIRAYGVRLVAGRVKAARRSARGAILFDPRLEGLRTTPYLRGEESGSPIPFI